VDPNGPLEIDDPLNVPIDVLADCFFRRIDAAVGRVAEFRFQGQAGRRADALRRGAPVALCPPMIANHVDASESRNP